MANASDSRSQCQCPLAQFDHINARFGATTKLSAFFSVTTCGGAIYFRRRKRTNVKEGNGNTPPFVCSNAASLTGKAADELLLVPLTTRFFWIQSRITRHACTRA